MTAKTLSLKNNIKRAEASAKSKAIEDTAQVLADTKTKTLDMVEPALALTVTGRLTRDGFTAKSFYMNDALLEAAERVISGPIGAVMNYALAYTMQSFMDKRAASGQSENINVELPDATRGETLDTKGFLGIKDTDFVQSIKWAKEELARAELAKAQAKVQGMALK